MVALWVLTLPDDPSGVKSDGSQEQETVLEFGTWLLLESKAAIPSLEQEQVVEEVEAVVVVEVGSLEMQDLLDKVCRMPLCIAGQISPAQHMGKTDCAHAPDGF